MKALDRFMAGTHHALASVLVIIFVSIARLLLEIQIFDRSLGLEGMVDGFILTAVFYTTCFFLFSLLLRLVLSRPFEKVANAASVGLLFGLWPPLLDLLLIPGPAQQYRFFSGFTPTLFAANQPLSESLVLWGLVLACAVFTFIITRSLWRTILALIGAYAAVQLVTVVRMLLDSVAVSSDPRRGDLACLGLSLLCYLALRGRQVLGSLARVSHALPHSLLALGGAAWVGRSLGQGAEPAVLLLLVIFVLILQNDHFDREEDRLSGRESRVTQNDVVWSSFLLFLLLVWLLPTKPVLAFILLLFYVTTSLYHHPAVRLKSRFCLSYKAEGTGALLAFLAGATTGSGFPPGADLLVPALLVFGGGSLLSIPKDFKDVSSDRQAGNPTYYVVLTRRGRSEVSAHRWIVAAVTLGLLVPPVALLFSQPLCAWLFVLLGLAGAPAAALLLVKNRKWAVMLMLWALAAYIFVLALALSAAHSA